MFACDDTENDIYEKVQMHNVIHQQIFSDEDETNDDNCNMISSKDNEVVLRMPTQEEINHITTNMVAEVQTHGMISKDNVGKVASIFVKEVDPKGKSVSKPKEGHKIKVKSVSKKWEAKKEKASKGPKPQNNDRKKGEEKASLVIARSSEKKTHNTTSTIKKKKEVKFMNCEKIPNSPIDMLSMLLQITIKVPLSELLRIPEHKVEVMAWVVSLKDGSNLIYN